MTELQAEIIKEARIRMQDHSWFKGVCTNNLPTDAMIREDREKSIDVLINETMYWYA